MHEHEIVDLSWKLFDGLISEQELERFESLCLTDKIALRHYLEVAELHIGLYAIFAPQDAPFGKLPAFLRQATDTKTCA